MTVKQSCIPCEGVCNSSIQEISVFTMLLFVVVVVVVVAVDLVVLSFHCCRLICNANKHIPFLLPF